MKMRSKILGIPDIRVNSSGCLERCEFGPTMVIYPEGIWYHYETREDVDEILQSHVIDGQPVKRLMLADSEEFPPLAKRKRLTLLVDSARKVSETTLRLDLVNSDGSILPKFAAGSHINLEVGEPPLRRSYYLANNPSERDRYVIGIQLAADSRGGSRWIHEHLAQGDCVQSSYPINNFSISSSAKSHLLVAENIGIAPILAMHFELQESGAEFSVHYFVDDRQRDPFLTELEYLAGDRLKVYKNSKVGENFAILESLLSENAQNRHLYLCGSGEFVMNANKLVSHWSQESVDLRGLDGVPPKNWLDSEFNVSLARRKTVLKVKKDQSILDVMRKKQLADVVACEDGSCGACHATILHGAVEHRHANSHLAGGTSGNQIMTCVSRARAGEKLLILDI